MIKYILFVATLLPISLVAQNDAKVSHTEIIEVKGASAKTLTDRANTFMTLKRIETKTAANIISGVGSLTVSYPSIKFGTDQGYVKFNLKMIVKDGKYKIDFTDFKHEGMQGKSTGGSIDLEKPECGESQLTNAAWTKIKAQTQEQIKAFVQELKKKMDNPVKAAAPNNDF